MDRSSSSSHQSYSHESYYARNGHLSPTLVARLSNNIRIPSPRQSTFPRPMAYVFDPITSFARRIRAVIGLLDCDKFFKIMMSILVVAFLASVAFTVIAIFTSPMAITEVEYFDCSAVGRGEDCTVVSVPASEYVLDPIVLYEPREHQ